MAGQAPASSRHDGPPGLLVIFFLKLRVHTVKCRLRQRAADATVRSNSILALRRHFPNVGFLEPETEILTRWVGRLSHGRLYG